MKIFILEDNEDRIDYFRKLFCLHDLAVSKTARSAIIRLGATDFDMIFLDHDLGDEQMVSIADKNTGSEVVRYILSEEIKKQAIFFLHTQNPVAARTMRHSLKDKQYRVFIKPFTLLYTEFPLQ